MQKIHFTDVPLAARPSSKTWEVVSRESASGNATLYRLEDGSYMVQWAGEDEPTPLAQLGYNSELGVFDKVVFPDVKED